MSRAASGLKTLGIGALVVVRVFSCVAFAGADKKVDPVIESLLAAHNAERHREHKTPLRLAPKLCEAAKAHAGDMARHQRLDHKGSDGSTVVDRIKRAGYIYVRIGENIADGQKNVDEVMRSWMKSPGHRANILAEFTELGAARVGDDQGLNYWCVDFGIPIPRLKPDEAAAAVIEEINHAREAGGTMRLKVEPKLGRAAMAISAAMAAKDSMDIDDPFHLVDQKDLDGRSIRLQMSDNVPSAKDAARELLGQHPDQLAAFREIGVGYAQAKSGTPYWCAIFAKRAQPNRRPSKTRIETSLP